MPRDQATKQVSVKTYFSPRSFESERYSDFDVFAAIGELIDNSLEAEAGTIHVRIDVKTIRAGTGRPKERAQRLVVADDGHGMPPELVEDCLIHGESSRYGSRTGIGRFGVGLVKGSISQCKRIDVYSRKKGGDWWRSHLDLDEIARSQSVEVVPATQERPPEDLVPLAGEDQGTVVVWTNLDLMPPMTERQVDEIRHWIGRTYRKRIAPTVVREGKQYNAVEEKNTDPVTIILNGRPIYPYDPLFVIPNVDGDEKAELNEPILIPDPHNADKAEEVEALAEALGKSVDELEFDPYKNPIRIRFSLLPLQLRGNKHSGGNIRDGHDHVRRVPDNTGFSILRFGREVYYGPWLGKLDLGAKSVGQNQDRYWGMEIAFDPVYDELFTVRNIKIGAKPVSDLRRILEERIRPVLDRYRDRIQQDWADAELKGGSGDANESTESGPPHDEPTSRIGDSIPPKNVQPTEEETQKLVQAVKRRGYIQTDVGPEAIAQLHEFIEALSHRYNILEDNAAGTQNFIDVYPEGGKAIITCYVTHPFFRFRQELVNRLKAEDTTKDDLVLDAANLRRMTDLMLMGFANGYIECLREDPERSRRLLDTLMFKWSSTMREFISKLESQNGGESD